MKYLPIVVFTFASCNGSIEHAPMDAFEKKVADFTGSEQVEFYQQNITSTTGNETVSENFLSLDLYNSTQLSKMKQNTSLLERTCTEIADSVKHYMDSSELYNYDAIKIKVIESDKILFFNKSSEQVVEIAL